MDLSTMFDHAPQIEINELGFDSRKKMDHGMFFCLTGINTDGHEYIDQAIENGAVCIVHSKPVENKKSGVVYVKVENVSATMNRIAARFYDYPTKKLKVYGITGTNGKSTTAKIIRDVLSRFEPCGYIGTISISYGDVVLPPDLTTPDAISLQKISKDMVQAGMKALALEVSSIGLELHRVDAISFDVAIFTNFTYDHLDFHGTMENYLEAKKRLFSMMDPSKYCVINADDEYFEEIKQACNGKIVTYGIQKEAIYRADNITLGTSGSTFTLVYEGQEYPVQTNLIALYNIYNLLGAIAALHRVSGLELVQILECLNNLEQVDGRLEKINEGQPFNVFVDFAHTPDGFEKVFEYAKMITPEDRNIIAVFGSAGKRDIKKRKVFGAIADKYCSSIILTEDDPRDEDPSEIAAQIRQGIEDTNCVFIENRYDAIRQSIEMAGVDDTILILGKGDETFIYREDGREPYCGDHVAAKDIIKKYYLGIEEEQDENE